VRERWERRRRERSRMGEREERKRDMVNLVKILYWYRDIATSVDQKGEWVGWWPWCPRRFSTACTESDYVAKNVCGKTTSWRKREER
jgi:hypothetical protein